MIENKFLMILAVIGIFKVGWHYIPGEYPKATFWMTFVILQLVLICAIKAMQGA